MKKTFTLKNEGFNYNFSSLFFSRSFLIAYAPPAAAKRPNPPSMGAASGESGKPGNPGGPWAKAMLVIISTKITGKMNSNAVFIDL